MLSVLKFTFSIINFLVDVRNTAKYVSSQFEVTSYQRSPNLTYEWACTNIRS